MTAIKERTMPKEENRETYEKLYKIYLELYNHLKDLFPKLASSILNP